MNRDEQSKQTPPSKVHSSHIVPQYLIHARPAVRQNIEPIGVSLAIYQCCLFGHRKSEFLAHRGQGEMDDGEGNDDVVVVVVAVVND